MTTLPKGFLPGAIVKNITPGSNDPAIVPVGVVLHVAVSKSDSLYGLFTHDGGIESHFYVRYDGTIEQYRSIFFEADAQASGNSFSWNGKVAGLVSVETEGMGAGEWTAHQIASIKEIIDFVEAHGSFPRRVCPAWNQPGVGYHRMFSPWNPNSHSCPGDGRVKQFNDVIVPWLRTSAKKPGAKPASRVKNHVTDFHAELNALLHKYEAKVPKSRKAVHGGFAKLRGTAGKMPKA